MGLAHLGAQPHWRGFGTLAAIILALATIVADPIMKPNAALTAAAVSGPRAVVVVGPVGSMTSAYVREARQIVEQLRSDGARVREVYSPDATWSRVVKEARGANLFIYLGHGRGHPGPYGVFDPRSMNGLGLNRAPASGHWNIRHYGEFNVRGALDLTPGAVVILGRVPYAAGSSEPGWTNPTRLIATRRADNYAAGFLDAGAASVFASDRSVVTIVRDLFGAERTMQSVFWRSPWTSSRYDSIFASSQIAGVSGILAPYSPGRYYQSVVGRLGWTTSDWKRTWSPTSGATSSVRVSSISALLSALADNAVTEIVVANGTYRVSPAGAKRSDSLWIGARFAGRVNPVTVRAETRGGVTFDGGGSTYFGCISFVEGSHHQTWDGFQCAGGQATETGVVTFGGYAGLAAPHHITLRHFTIAASCTGRATTVSSPSLDHAIYVSQAIDGPHDLLLEDIAIDGTGGLASAVVFYHSDSANLNAWNVTVRRLRVSGTQQAIMLWDPTLRDITFDGADITDALNVAVRYESPGATGIVLANITSTGSGSGKGFHSSLGPSPPGVTFVNNSFH